jgi:hypothetical protein
MDDPWTLCLINKTRIVKEMQELWASKISADMPQVFLECWDVGLEIGLFGAC